jgi:hypothetical protein
MAILGREKHGEMEWWIDGMLPSNLFPVLHDSTAAKNRRPVSRTAVWHEGQFRPLRLLFSLAAVFATGLALFLAAGGAVVTAALFAGAAGGEHR